MRKIIAALFSAALMASSASASDEVDVIKKVNEFVDAFNKSDLKTAIDTCAAQTFIIDQIPPYAWQGATGCTDWSKDFEAFAKKNGITEPKVTLGRANIDVTDNRAYVVAPAYFAFTQKGKRVSEQGSTLTVALQNISNKWQITGWTWTKRKN